MPVFKTQLTEMLGIEHPIVCGGMTGTGMVELTAAVSNAGCLGMLTALNFGTPENFAKAIQDTRKLTDKPFGVNLTILPSLNPPDYDAFAQAIIDGGVKVVETAGNNPKKASGPARTNNNIVIVALTVAVY